MVLRGWNHHISAGRRGRGGMSRIPAQYLINRLITLVLTV